MEGLPGVCSVEPHGDEPIVTSVDGAATIGAVAVALSTVTPVRHLTLRTPTLDDVFLKLTGNHIESDEHPSEGTGSVEAARGHLAEVGR